MLKYLPLALLLAATPSIAQTSTPPQYAQALNVLMHQAVEREAAATAEVLILRGQIADLTKERDALKSVAKAAPEAPKKSD